MFLTQSFFAIIAIWIAYATYTTSLFPQIRLNFKRKSTNGLSDLFLLGLFNRNVMWIGYVFALGLPISYKVMSSVLALVTVVLVVQRLMYRSSGENNKTLYAVYGINTLVLLMLVFYASFYSVILGHCLGWGNIAIGFVNEVPQAVKMHKKRTCAGFSFYFVIISLFAYSFEFCAALILHLPFQVFICALKGLFFRLLFISQFFAYRRLFFGFARVTNMAPLYTKRYLQGISLEKVSLSRSKIGLLKQRNKNKEFVYDFIQ